MKSTMKYAQRTQRKLNSAFQHQHCALDDAYDDDYYYCYYNVVADIAADVAAVVEFDVLADCEANNQAVAVMLLMMC